MTQLAVVDMETGEFVDAPIAESDAAEIGALFRRANASHVESVNYLLQCGYRLKQKKESLSHGHWLPWIEANKQVLGFGVSTVKRLISAAQKFLEVNNANRALTRDLPPADCLKINRLIWGNHNHRAQGTGENEWYTPVIYIEAARNVLGAIDLDPASSECAQEIVKATEFFDEERNGLEEVWHGRVWLNPPYSQPLIQQFIEKLCAEVGSGRVTAAILLTHNYTDTEWFHIAARACTAICFTRGRIKFVNPQGEEAAPTQGQAFMYFGDDIEAFIASFETFGVIVVRP